MDYQFTAARTGTVAICAGAVWLLIGGLLYLWRVNRVHPGVPSRRQLLRAEQRLGALLGTPELPPAAVRRALRLGARYERWRGWLSLAFQLPLCVLMVGELLHLFANVVTVTRHESLGNWHFIANGASFAGSVALLCGLGPLLLASSPRLVIVRHVLNCGRALRMLTEERRGDHIDAMLRRLNGLTRRVASYFILSHPAGDPHTRARLVGVANGLYGLLVDAKQDLLFADALTLMTARQTLWLTLASVAADPGALTEAERAAVGSPHPVEHLRSRLAYRAVTMLVVLTVGGSMVGLWYADHSAMSVIFSAVAAPLLVPAVIGLARRGWRQGEQRAAHAPAPEALTEPATEVPAVA